ncbi:MAG: hypothetical protein AB7K04_14150 [Pseudorhodoplanes sp.]
MTRWPWITSLLLIAIFVSPFGREVFHNTFHSDEAFAREINGVTGG